MYVRFVIVLLLMETVSFVTVGSRSLSSNLQYLTRESNCSWMKNVETDKEFAGHEYIVAENCLYYYLQDKSNNGRRASPSLLQIAAPSTNGSRITVTVRKLELVKVYIEDGQSKATIKGSFKLFWRDPRVKWDIDEWKLKSLRIVTSSHIWHPGFHPSLSTTNHEFGFVSLQTIVAYPNASINGRLDLNIHSRCKVDFTNFPHDEHECCFNLYSPNFANLLQFELENEQGVLGADWNSAGWTARSIRTTIERDENSDNQHLRVCTTLARDVGNLKIELTVPMSVAALIWLTSALFGSLKHQIMAKLFALLLQFLCFQFLVQRSPTMGISRNTPKVFQYYEFTLAITLVNILITVIFYGLTRKEYESSPSHKTLSFCQHLNARIYCCNEKEFAHEDDISGQQTNKGAKVNKQEEWSEIFFGFNAFFSVVASIGYLIGITIIFCW